MFLVLLSYERPLTEIDALMGEHLRYLERCYAAGVFLVSGRREPRTGGVILARAASRGELEPLIELDPFVREGVATYEIIEFRTSQHHPSHGAVADPGTRPMGKSPPA